MDGETSRVGSVTEALNSPYAVVGILGITFIGAAALFRELSFMLAKLNKNSALDRNAKVLEEMVVNLKSQGLLMEKLVDRVEFQSHQIERTQDMITKCQDLHR